MINFFWYDGQLRRYLLQFCNIFVGLQVETGNGACETPEYLSVPIRIGSRDRVVAALEAGNTQNKPFTLPAMSVHMTNLALAPQMRKGVGVEDHRVSLPQGGVFPNDLRTISRVMPIPYTMSLELAMYASNTMQLHQILEQILMLFDPVLQLQMTDAAADWTKLTTVELTGINNEENYAPGADRRIVVWSLNFDMPIYITPPMDVKNQVVHQIKIRLSDMSNFHVDEVGLDGELSPFLSGYDSGGILIDVGDETNS